MKVLVLGATGYLGRHLIPNLGFCDEVRCLVRTSSDVSSIQLDNVELFVGNLKDKDSIEKAIQDIDIVIHSAVNTSSEDKEDQKKVNVIGTQNIIDLCQKYPIKKLIYISAVGVLYSEKDTNSYIETKKLAEKIVLNANLNSIILRPSLIYKKNSTILSKVNLLRFLPILIFPEWVYNYPLQQPVYIQDVVNSVVTAIKTDQIRKNKPYAIVGPGTDTLSEIIDQTTIFPFKPLKIKTPAWLNRILFAIYKSINAGKINPEFFSEDRKPYYFDWKEAQKDFSYNPVSFADVLQKKMDQ